LIKNASEDYISVYNTTGQIVANVRASGSMTAVKVPFEGIYIVNVGGKVQKVLVK